MKYIKISFLVMALLIGTVLFQGIVSLSLMAIVLNETSAQHMIKQSRRSVDAIESYMEALREELLIKSVLIGGQKRIIDFSRYGLNNLLVQELTEARKSAQVDYLSVRTASYGGVFSGEISLPVPPLEEESPGTLPPRVFLEKAGGQIWVTAHAPLLHDGSFVGVLTARIILDESLLDAMERMVDSRLVFRGDDEIIAIREGWGEEIFSLFQEDLLTGNLKPGLWQSRYYLDRIPLEREGQEIGAFYSLTDGSSIFELASRYRFIIVLVFSFTSISALFFGYLLYRTSFRRPFEAVLEGVSQIGKGNFHAVIKTEVRNEFAVLGGAINAMTRDLVNRDEKIGELSRYLTLVLQSVQSGIVVLDNQGRITQCNGAARSILDLPVLDLPDSRTGELLPPRLLSIVEKYLLGDEEAFPAGAREITVKTPREERLLGLQISPLMGEGTGRSGLVVVFDDRTEVRSLQARLALSERLAALGEMASEVAHQIRNPLGIMSVSAQMLGENLADLALSPQDQKLVQVILAEVETLRRVAESFLTFGRPIEANFEPVSARALVQDLLATIPSSVSVTLEFDPSLPPLWVDPNLLSQALGNIICNSLEAMSRDGNYSSVRKEDFAVPDPRITIRGKRGGEGQVLITLSDTGPGIPPEIVSKIYNPFFTTKAKGTGLGLSIVHRCLEVQGISLDIVSNPGEGCRVLLAVPVSSPERNDSCR